MKKYILKDLDCPHCAQKIEDHLNDLGFDVIVSYVNKTLIVNKEIDFDVLQKEVTSVEDEVRLVEEGIEVEEKSPVVIFILSILLLVAGILLKGKISLVLCLISYILVGYKVIIKSFKNVVKGEIFDENFLMMIATFGAFAIKEYPEAVMVMLLYQIGEYIQDKAVEKSRKSISDLIELKSEDAIILENGKEVIKDVHDVKVGDVMLVKQGDRIALDGEVIEGNATIDTCSLTGEMDPVFVEVHDKVLSGCINVLGMIKVRVESDEKNSTVAKILNMIEESSNKKTVTEKFITRFSKVYTPVVVLLALLIGIVPPLFGLSWSNWIYKSIVFLVVSCPCALVISVPLGFYMGIGACSKRGILVKGSSYLELLAKCNSVCFDKTGTITDGEFVVKDVKTNGISEMELVKYTLSVEKGSLHPLVVALNKKYSKYEGFEEIEEYEEIKGLGAKGSINKKEVIAGNSRLMEKYNVSINEEEGTVIYVAINRKYVGCFIFEDHLKEDANIFIEELRNRNINDLMMLSGDKKEKVVEVGKVLNVPVKGELLPAGKVEVIKEKRKENNIVVYLGDGINDAPVLVESDVGVSMGTLGSDVAIEASDVVIVDDNPYKVVEGIDIARKTKNIIWFNIIFALVIKIGIMILAMFNISSLPLAIFGDVGVTILTILNCIRINIRNY